VFIVCASVLPAAWTIRNGVEGGYWGPSKTPLSFLSSIYGTQQDTAFESGTNTFDTKGSVAAIEDLTVALQERPGSAATTLLRGAGLVVLGPGEWAMRNHYLGEIGARDAARVVPFFSLRESTGSLEIAAHVSAASTSGRSAAWWLLAWSWVATGATYVLAAWGGYAAIRSRNRWAMALLCAAALLVVASAGHQANARFRVPVLPLLLIAAAGRADYSLKTTNFAAVRMSVPISRTK
jgi:hypothetical protein